MIHRSCITLLAIFIFLPQTLVAEDYPTAFGVRLGAPISEVVKAYEDRWFIYFKYIGDVNSDYYQIHSNTPLVEFEGVSFIEYYVFKKKLLGVTVWFETCQPLQPEICESRYENLKELLYDKYGIPHLESAKGDIETDILGWRPVNALSINLHTLKDTSSTQNRYSVALSYRHRFLLEEYEKYEKQRKMNAL